MRGLNTIEATVSGLVTGSGGGGVLPAAASGIAPLVNTVTNSYLYYLLKTLFPFTFNAFPGEVPSGQLYSVLAVCAMASLVAFVIWAYARRKSIKAFSVFWFLVTLAPSVLIAVLHISMSKISSGPLAERYLYIPSAGFCLLGSFLLVRAGEHTRRMAPVGAAALVLLTVFAVVAVERQRDWSSPLAIWKDTANKSPDHALPLKNYGKALIDSGRVEEGKGYYARGLALETAQSRSAVEYNSMGLEHLDAGRYAEAEEAFINAGRADLRYGPAFYNLARTYYETGVLRGSEQLLKKAVKQLDLAMSRYKRRGELHMLYARCHIELGDYQGARRHLGQAKMTALLNEQRIEANEIQRMILEREARGERGVDP